MERAVIVEGARTPIGKFLGAFADVPAVDLGVAATREALRRAGVELETVDNAVYGHARQAGNGPNTGRQVAYRSGLPQEVPGFNVNMACGSGVKAVQVAAGDIALGNAEVVVAGGMENMTRKYDIPRREQDEFALASQQKSEVGKARRAEEIVPVEVSGPKGESTR